MDNIRYMDQIDLYFSLLRNPHITEEAHFESIAESFERVAYSYLTWDAQEQWDILKLDGPLVVMEQYFREKDRAVAMHADTFAAIVDFIALQYWKAARGRSARLQIAQEWMEALLSRLGRFDDLLELIRLHHPVAYDTIAAEGVQREAERRARMVARCLEVKEELMMRTWHPSRVERLLFAGYDVEDM